MPQHSVFAYVCFERTPLNEIGRKVTAFEQRGWTWVDKHARWIARMRKEVDRPLSFDAVEQEIRDVMGDSYAGLAELGAPGSTFGKDPVAVSSHENPLTREQALMRELVAAGWEPTAMGETVMVGSFPWAAARGDPVVECQGGAQLAIKPIVRGFKT